MSKQEIELNKEYQVQRGELAGVILKITVVKESPYPDIDEKFYGDGNFFFRASNLKPLHVATVKPNVKSLQ